MPLSKAIEQCEQVEGVSTQAKKGFLNFHEIIQSLRARIRSAKVSEFVDLVMKKSGYLEHLGDKSLVNEDRIENLKELVSVAKAFDKLSLDDFLSEVSLLADIDSHSSEQDSVTLMTLHSAKGLEFDTVFITGVEENIFPHSRSVVDNEQLEEERRLMYVGMTRAKKRLFLINATSRMIYGSTQYNSPSRFISDIPNDLIQKEGDNFRRGRAEPRLSGRDLAQKNDLKKGDRVFHPYFGEGKVLSVEDDFANVDFYKKGMKDLNLEYAPLKKLV
jgi:DNA helicase-2/ATP-dependent DNA helicase PcrA